MRCRVVSFVGVLAVTLVASPAWAGDSAPPLKVIKLKPQVEVKEVGLQPEVDRLLKRIPDDRTDRMTDKQDFDTLVELGPRGVPALSAVLSDTGRDFDQRWIAARALGRIGTPDAMEQLKKTVAEDKFSMARLAAISSLKDAGERSAVPILTEALNDDAMVVRSAAADALARLGDVSVVPSLLEALDREDNFYKGKSLWVRRHIVKALGELESRGAVPKLVELIDDQDAEVGYQAIRSLEKCTRLSFRVPASSKQEYAKTAAPKWKEWWEENKSDYL